MKRVMIIVTICALTGILIGGVFWMNNTKPMLIGENVFEIREKLRDDIILDVNVLLVLKMSNGRSVCVTDGNTVIAEIKYAESGEMISKNRIYPLKTSVFDTSSPKTVRDMEDLFGTPHCDIGCGAYLPTYILEDGRIVTYNTNADVITGDTIRQIFDTQREK